MRAHPVMSEKDWNGITTWLLAGICEWCRKVWRFCEVGSLFSDTCRGEGSGGDVQPDYPYSEFGMGLVSLCLPLS